MKGLKNYEESGFPIYPHHISDIFLSTNTEGLLSLNLTRNTDTVSFRIIQVGAKDNIDLLLIYEG